jgi:hypothetical protein
MRTGAMAGPDKEPSGGWVSPSGVALSESLTTFDACRSRPVCRPCLDRDWEVLHQHCADIGRDPDGILPSARVGFSGDLARTAAEAAAFGAADAGLVVDRPPCTRPPCTPLANALSGRT